MKFYFKFIFILCSFTGIGLILFSYFKFNKTNTKSNKFPIKSIFERNLNRNFRPDFSIDSTCTLPYVSRSCVNLISDYIFDHRVKNVEPVSKLKSGDVIMVGTNLLNEFFHKVFPKISCFIILISHNSDDPLEASFKLFLEDKRIVAWFASNPTFHHPKLVTFPIGFEDTNWNPPKINYIRDVNISSLIQWQKRKILLYINFQKLTHMKTRGYLKDYFKNKFPNVFIEEKVNYSTFLQRLGDSKYVLCPRGNGLDTHRFYETVLMGSIPIVEDSFLRPIFNETTSLVLNDFRNLTINMILHPELYIGDMSFSKRIIFFNTWLKKIDQLKLKYTNKKYI
jgi:hypothetical protein